MVYLFCRYDICFWRPFGKIGLGCIVIKKDGAQIALIQSLVRESIKISGLVISYIGYNLYKSENLFIFLLFPIILLLTVLFSKQRRGLHDKISNTSVIKQKILGKGKFSVLEQEQKNLNKFIGIGTILPIAIFVSSGWFTSSRLFNMLMGAWGGFSGACIGAFLFYLIKRFKKYT